MFSGNGTKEVFNNASLLSFRRYTLLLDSEHGITQGPYPRTPIPMATLNCRDGPGRLPMRALLRLRAGALLFPSSLLKEMRLL